MRCRFGLSGFAAMTSAGVAGAVPALARGRNRIFGMPFLATGILRRPLALAVMGPRGMVEHGIERAGLDLQARQPSGKPSLTMLGRDRCTEPLRQGQIETDLGVDLACIGKNLEVIAGSRERHVRVVPGHRRAGPDKGLIGGQTLGAVDRRAVGVAKTSTAMLVKQLGDTKPRRTSVDVDVERGIRRFATVDTGNEGGCAVDDGEAVMANQKADMVADREGQRLAVAGRRHGGDFDIFANKASVALQPGAN